MLKKYFILSLLTCTPLLEAKTRKKAEPSLSHTQVITAPSVEQASPQPTLVKILQDSPAKRMVSITNNIKPEMLVYKHWSGDKVPEPFGIVVDGVVLEPGKSATVAVTDDKLNVQFNYSFMMGYRKGAREVTFKVPAHEEKLNMTFSWDNDHRIILDKAQPIEKREI